MVPLAAPRGDKSVYIYSISNVLSMLFNVGVIDDKQPLGPNVIV